MEWRKQIVAQLVRHEGFRSKPYRCSAGKLTIAIGRNLDDKGISRDEAFMMLRADIGDAVVDLKHHVESFFMMDEIRANVLINMTINMGIGGLLGFKKMLASVAIGDWPEAKKQMLDSKWATQVGIRSDELAEQMLTGEYRKEK